MKKSREEIINSMCLTWDHSYMMPETVEVFPGSTLGLTPEQKKTLWNRMAQLYDNDIAPYMRFKNQKDRSLTKEHGYARVGYDAMRRGK